MIRVVLPAHLRLLARVSGEVELEITGAATPDSVIDALEPAFPRCGALFVTRRPGSGANSCGSSPVKKTYRTSRWTPRCPRRSWSDGALFRGGRDGGGVSGTRPTLGAVDLFAKVLTVSDSVSRGGREDLAGPALAARLHEAGFGVTESRIVPDGAESVAESLHEMSNGFAGLIVTTGGTGFSPRDLTPEGTLRVIDREAPGLSEAVRLVNPLGRLSRGRAGTVAQCLILNLPGSPRGALECLESVIDVLGHALELLCDASSPHPPDTGGRTATSSS